MRNGKARRSPGAAALLALLAAGLGAINWHLAGSTIDISPVASAVVAGDAAAGNAPFSSGGAAAIRLGADLSETLARPLFRPDRRPPPSAGTAPSDVPAPVADVGAAAGDLVLAGVMHHGTKGSRALIRVAGKPAGVWVGAGETVGGWRVAAIEPDRVAVELNGATAELLLFAKRSKVAEPDGAAP